jgi:hypothetical protein
MRSDAREYSVGPFSLLQPLPSQSRVDYTCTPRPEFENTVSCNPNPKAATGTPNISALFLDTSSLSILYAYEKFSRTDTLDRVVKGMLEETSNSLGGSTAKRFSIDNAVALVWGDVKLEAVSPGATEYYEYNPSAGAIDRQFGLLVNAVGDFKVAKGAGRPLYRVLGGDGLIVVVCELTPGHVLVQRLIVAAGTLSEKKFKSQAADFLARDQHASRSDTSNWPEIAFAVRRLALDTTEENANKVVDEFFAFHQSKKYRSHVWAYLPTSVIKHLRDGKYMAVDIFG